MYDVIKWCGDHLQLLDQRKLPVQQEYYLCYRVTDVIEAIKLMVVRGAPAIGITAAYGAVLAARQYNAAELLSSLDLLAQARPTAINLHWAVERIKKRVIDHQGSQLDECLLAEANEIFQQEITANEQMAAYGAELIAQSNAPCNILTHCNTGRLATGGSGTALGVICRAYQQGLINQLFVDETRPWLQGSRLTCWELQQADIPFQLNVDGAAAHLIKTEKVSWVIVGADRITANGDVANKIGTYSLAVLARYHQAKLMVVAPLSTCDLSMASGSDIPLEYREATELCYLAERQLAPDSVAVNNPVFDITPAELVDFIVTEQGVVANPTVEKLKKLFEARAV
ncbi:S-methyl-5-thioribose-1-phosphate isomerase [Spartinivicinus poritis]|uniref:Methylthioribose-1-phosphate isomerase n=1 Tax=Spartinivicinus poritis TaxID=2994640 RepID=A0ABT5U8G9_9GAMM|nr:S-methyl-5-thioribose-1-phosphate isomerase [Spartinivicinus sp. A2-2]MDE1462301.1 S-methyl-5-thioribose-1-phosphate isomerase [Spartinivicinus sp. A2-2]